MRFPTVAAWLAWQQAAHPVEIDPGLDRAGEVWERLGRPLNAVVLTVGGTNGKGSVTAILDAILAAAGYEVGLFTSPHLHRYGERIRVHGREATEEELLAAFAAIDEARGDVSLTYFEWNALAAFMAFARAGVDVAVLEVGMGGRLDAVNLVDADAAAVVSVGLDHREWLGDTVEAIGYEKAGIFRANRPAIVGARRPPRSIVDHAAAIGARLKRIGTDFDFVERADGWDYVGFGSRRRELPLPGIGGAAQLGNAAVALAMLESVEPRLLVPDAAVRSALAAVRLSGRFQVIPGRPEWILDVAHNAQAAEALAASLAARRCDGRTLAVCGILGDKDVEGIAAALGGQVSEWIAVGLVGGRALPPAALAARLRQGGAARVREAADVAAGLEQARADMKPEDRTVVFGSFLTVGPALEWLGAGR